MKQFFIVEVNVPHDQYGFESDELAESLSFICNPGVKFHVTSVIERVNVARIESMLKE